MFESCTLFVLIITVLVAFPIVLTNIIFYLVVVSPQYFIEQPLRINYFPKIITLPIFISAYLLSIARLPFIILPYIAKLCCFLVLGKQFRKHWNSYTFQLLRLAADFANLFATGILLIVLAEIGDHPVFGLLACLVISAEIVRLLTEKGQTIFSAIWQKIPHQTILIWSEYIPTFFGTKNPVHQIINRYQAYYRLGREEKAIEIIRTIKRLAADNPEMAKKIRYVNSFRIVPDSFNLRIGNVRDVAGGEIFIHGTWVNDPWLLVGQLLRRTPWFFDPRYISRPFYYRTQTNRLATIFVLQHGVYSLPYAWYQLGQEIKAARYDIFYRILNWFGLRVEPPIMEDGTFEFDQFLRWLGGALDICNFQPSKRPLFTDEEVVVQIAAEEKTEDIPPDVEIARRYTYPILYVQEVLRPKIEAGVNKVERGNRQR